MINCHPIFAKYITKNLHLPTVCPCCGGDLNVTESGFVECPNMSCTNKVKHMFAEFFGKLEIEGAGEGFIENLSNHMSTITDAKPMTLAKFVSIFDLRGFGEKKFLDLDKLEPFNGFYEEPEAVLAAVTSQDIIKHHPASMVSEDVIKKFAMEFCLKREDMVNSIKTGEFSFAPALIKEVKDGKLSGKSFCFTGKAEAIGSRSKCEELVLANGGTISSVKKGLSFLVQEDPSSTSSKSVKAKSLGIAIISPEEFLEMVK